MTATSPLDGVISRASELARDGADPPDATSAVLAAAGGDRSAVAAARDQVAARIRARVDDFEATATLQLLNRVLADIPINDPLDWRVRWGQRFRKP